MRRELSRLFFTVFVAVACSPSEKDNNGSSATTVTLENFTVAETDRYFSEHAAQNEINTLRHARRMSSKDHQTVIRENQDTMYSNGLVDVSEGATIVNPPWDTYSSIQIIDENHYTVDVLYPGDSLYVTNDMVELGDHVYLNIRTGVPTLDSAGFAAAHAHQDEYVIRANSAKPYVPKNFDKTSLDSIRNVLLKEAVKVRAWLAFGKKNEVDSADFLMASAAGWAGLPVKHATYVTNIQPQGAAITGECASLTLPVPPLQFDKGGFFSVTAYGPDGYIATDNFALNNRQATPNPDGSYTFHFNCEGATNNIDVVENWNMTLRLYMPVSQEAILSYAERLTKEVSIVPLQ